MVEQLEFTGDYKTEFKKVVTQLEGRTKGMTREQRISLIEQVMDEYVYQTGERPDGSQLSRLADVVLNEELTDRHPDKMTREDYPIMSENQEGLRKEGKQRERNKTGTVTAEAPLEYAKNVATDARNYTLPVRSFFNPPL